MNTPPGHDRGHIYLELKHFWQGPQSFTRLMQLFSPPECSAGSCLAENQTAQATSESLFLFIKQALFSLNNRYIGTADKPEAMRISGLRKLICIN